MSDENKVWKSYKGLGKIAKTDKAPWNFAYMYNGSKAVFAATTIQEAQRQIEKHSEGYSFGVGLSWPNR